MTFWALAAIMTAAAVLATILPLLIRPRKTISVLARERGFHRARMRGIKDDLQVGRIDEAQALDAEAEAGRRLIRIDKEAQGDVPLENGGSLAKIALTCSLIFTPAFSILIYSAIGSPSLPDMDIEERRNQSVEGDSLASLARRAEIRLARNPNDLRGWVVLAPIQRRLGRLEEAVFAWRNALRLEPENPDHMINLAETITIASSGVITEEALLLFESALELRPSDLKARFHLAVASEQKGDLQKAARQWSEIIKNAPQDAEWLDQARQRLENAQAGLRSGNEAEDEAGRVDSSLDSAPASDSPPDSSRPVRGGDEDGKASQ